MPVDRDAALRKVDQLLKQGKIAGAIDEYKGLIEDRPGDWNAFNALGDLYAKAGDMNLAAEQFVHAADHLYGQGFLPRAAALYKKALKVKRDDDHAIWQLADIAGYQGLSLEARSHYGRLIQSRRAAGDERGAIDCVIRLGQLSDADVAAKMAAADALVERGESSQAARLVMGAADLLTKAGHSGEALEKLQRAAQLDPNDPEIAEKLAAATPAAPPVDVVEPEPQPQPDYEAYAVDEVATIPMSEPEGISASEPEPYELPAVPEAEAIHLVPAAEASEILAPESAGAAPVDAAMTVDPRDTDPTAVLAGMASAPEPEPAVVAAPVSAEPLPLEDIFEALRDRVSREQGERER